MHYWTTVDRPEHEQFSYWRDVICEAFTPLAPRRTSSHRPGGPRDAGITSWVRSTPLVTTNCAEVSSESQLITHGDAEIRRTSSEQVFVNLQLSGHCVGEQDGRRCVVPPGGFAMFDTTRAYSLEFVADPERGEWRVVSFRVPRSSLLPLLDVATGFTSVRHGGGAAAAPTSDLVASTMMSIWRTVDGLGPRAADAAEAAFTTLLASDIGGGDELRDTRREAADGALRAAIGRYARTRLRTADLSPRAVAQRYGISVRKLHALYEGTERSYTQTIMAMRVDACVRDLGTGPADRTLTEIASRWGFCDLSHLNRVFRAYRGCLPSEYRRRAGGASPSSLEGPADR